MTHPTDRRDRAAYLRYAWPHLIRSLRTRPLRARLLADIVRRRNP
ncbi:hypothetical protein [Micromonospora aurantiaca (nom. illeg.)]